MESPREPCYRRRIAELEAENAALREQNARLTERVARLSKNSSNSSEPPSSDIVKPPKPEAPKRPRKRGGQAGHPGAHRPPFRADQIDRVEERHPTRCPHAHAGRFEPTGRSKVQQVAELREKPLEITEYRLHESPCLPAGRAVRPAATPSGPPFRPAWSKGNSSARVFRR